MKVLLCQIGYHYYYLVDGKGNHSSYVVFDHPSYFIEKWTGGEFIDWVKASSSYFERWKSKCWFKKEFSYYNEFYEAFKIAKKYINLL